MQRSPFVVTVALAGLLVACTGEATDSSPVPSVTAGVVRTESTERLPMDIPFWVGENQLRLDVSVPLDMSVVWRFGPNPEMLMIEHRTGRYVAWGPGQFEGARRLMAARPPEIVQIAFEFEVTGRTETVADWGQLSEVIVDDRSGELQGSLWVTSGTGFDLVDLLTHFDAALDGTTQFPMTGGDNDVLGLGDWSGLPLGSLEHMDGRPAGRAIRIQDQGARHTITLVSSGTADSDDTLFTAPEGYEQVQSLGSDTP